MTPKSKSIKMNGKVRNRIAHSDDDDEEDVLYDNTSNISNINSSSSNNVNKLNDNKSQKKLNIV